jgi:3-deoxy-D-arabino-heptulosonate 7-phosphate (DAHP) synthase class II
MRCRYDYRARTTGASRQGAHAVRLLRSKEPMGMADQAEFDAWMVDYLRRNSAVKRFASH